MGIGWNPSEARQKHISGALKCNEPVVDVHRLGAEFVQGDTQVFEVGARQYLCVVD
jgi:hypothetical protein